MDDLIVWLRAQLDDDERVASQVIAEQTGFYLEAETPGDNVMTISAHVYRWTPARVLAEIDAKRRILDEHAPVPEGAGWGIGQCQRCMDGDDVYDDETRAPCRTIRLLAAPYAVRPGYRDEWNP